MTAFDRRNFLKQTGTAGALAFGGLHGCAPSNQPGNRPNILFILADDHTTQAISCYGGMLGEAAGTRNIDRIGREGIRLDNCFCTNSICSPSRATILTGEYSHKNGVYCLDQPFAPPRPHVAELFQQGGYQTALMGKWHLKNAPTGFDDYMVLPRQGRYRNPVFNTKGQDGDVEYQGHSTDVITDLTLDWIERRDETRPFLMMCHYKATHDPWDSDDRFKHLYAGMEMPEPDNLLDTYDHRSEAVRRTTLKLEYLPQSTYPHDHPADMDRDTLRRHVYQQYIKDFLRCGAGLDANVGRLLDYLDASGLADNTIVIYSADQGHFLGEHGFFSKRFMYEESMRMPFLVRYPGVTNPGRVNDDLIINADFAPTLLDCAGLDVPAAMQGRSFLPNLAGETPADWRTSVYYRYWQHIFHREVAAHYGIRTKEHKLIFYYGQALGQTKMKPTEPEWELFDLRSDPGEMRNVYGDFTYTSVTAQLKENLLHLKQQYDDTDDAYPEMVDVAARYWS